MTAHMICGSTGAGKTTYSIKLAQDLGALRFSIDEWMMTLFWPDAPASLDADWALERVARCVQQMQAVIDPLVHAKVDAVVDIAFSTRADRSQFFEWASQAGVPVRLHFLDVPTNVRWQRVRKRNEERGETHAFEVTRDMFDFVEGRWEPPTQDELDSVDSIVISG